MGFRHPVLTADPVARDTADRALEAAAAAQAAADSAQYAADNGIIPGTRLAADAVNGKTLTGVTIQTAPVTGSLRGSVTDANGSRWFNDAGEKVTEVRTADGRLIARGADLSGLIRTSETGPRIELEQAPAAPANGSAGSSGWVRLYTGVQGVGPAGMTLDVVGTDTGGGISIDSTQLYLGGPQAVTQDGYVAIAERSLAAGGYEGVVDVVAQDRIYLGAPLVHGPGEWSTSGGMRSAWHAWHNIDNFAVNYLAPVAGWTAGLCHWMIRGGWGFLTVRLGRASWGVNQVIGYLPTGTFPAVSLDVAAVNDNGATAGAVRVRDDGAIYCLNSGSAGIHFHAIWPVKL